MKVKSEQDFKKTHRFIFWAWMGDRCFGRDGLWLWITGSESIDLKM